MDLLSVLLAVLAGIFTSIEATLNARLGKYITPTVATLHSLIVGTIFMLIINLFRGNIGNYTKIIKINPILLIGGIFGANIIYLSSKAILVLGISNTLILILSGELLSGLIIDVLQNNIEISAKKMAGMALFLIGTIMFLKE